jgi:hypothetical protein
MQILYVGNGNYNHKGARYYDVGRKIVNGLVRNGHNVYFFSDRDVSRSSSVVGSRKLGVRQCNRAFLETCVNFKPALIVMGHVDIISNESLNTARLTTPGLRVVQFNVDPLFRPENVDKIVARLPFVDATFVTTAGPVLKWFSHPQGIASYIPNPVDISMEWPRCHESSDQAKDVFWALRAGRKLIHGDKRTEFPLFLEQSGRVRMDFHGMNGKPELFGAAYYREIAAARMGLNISIASEFAGGDPASELELYLYSSDRIAHYMGSGLLTLTTRDNKLEDLFEEDRELIFFSCKDELLDKVMFYKDHDDLRKHIAKAGWEKYHKQFNETRVAQYIVETTLRQPYSRTYDWPTTHY